MFNKNASKESLFTEVRSGTKGIKKHIHTKQRAQRTFVAITTNVRCNHDEPSLQRQRTLTATTTNARRFIHSKRER